MKHVDSGNPGRSCGNCPAALPDSDCKRVRVSDCNKIIEEEMKNGKIKISKGK